MSRVLPILFNTNMVRAILDGRKTVTRRVVKPQPKSRLCYTFAGCNYGTWSYPSDTVHEFWGEEYKLPDYITDEDKQMVWKPPYNADDVLYVRETWQYLYELDGNEQVTEGTGKYYYSATDTLPFDTYVDSMGVSHERVPWRPSIHMPKEAARIWLKVKDVRVERLQDMDEDDAFAEGVSPWDDRCYANNGWKPTFYDPDSGGACCPLDAFEDIWNYTIKKSELDRYGWDANPWVWVIEFERCEKPERTV